MAKEGFRWRGRQYSRFGIHRFHHIDGGDVTRDLRPGSRLLPEQRLITQLHDEGCSAADRWLTENLQDLGQKLMVDLEEAFL